MKNEDRKEFIIAPSWTERLAGDVTGKVITLLRKRARWLKRQIDRSGRRMFSVKRQCRLGARLNAVLSVAKSQGITLLLQ